MTTARAIGLVLAAAVVALAVVGVHANGLSWVRPVSLSLAVVLAVGGGLAYVSK